MSLDGTWVALTPFFVAFAITLFPIAFMPHTWIGFYQNLRNRRLTKYKKRKSDKQITTLQRIYGGMDVYWWAPIVVYFLCTGMAVLGIAFFRHEGYNWENAIPADKNVPELFIGFWLVIILMAAQIAGFLRPTLDRNGADFMVSFGAWLLHLVVWITMVTLHWSGWFQLPLFIGITLVFIMTSLSFMRSNDRFVTISSAETKCRDDEENMYAAGCPSVDQ